MKLTDPAAEFDPKPPVPQPLLEGPLAALLEWQAMAEGAYSPNTLRAQKADGAIFQAFCEGRGERYLPAGPGTIRAFIQHCVTNGKKPSTIKRYVATIARVHVAAGLLNPCSGEIVRLGLKKMGRETSARQDQAHPLGWKDIKDFIASAGGGLRADRERALLCVAYETLARRSELVALDVRDVDFLPDGTGQALIRRGKTDSEGQGRMAYLSRETVRWLKLWLEHASICEGVVFRRLVGQHQIGGPLNPGSIAPIFKRVAQWIGMPERFVNMVSGHSTRVGATQDLAALDIDLAAITQAGGWKSTRMPLQYAEKINAARSGMARAAAIAGRDASTPEEE
jgi:site-specific recombinase XerD